MTEFFVLLCVSVDPSLYKNNRSNLLFLHSVSECDFAFIYYTLTVVSKSIGLNFTFTIFYFCILYSYVQH